MDGGLVNDRPDLPPLGASVEADTLGAAIRERLSAMLAAGRPPLDEELDELFAAVDRFHEAVFAVTEVFTVRCARGCANCCSQMVYDVGDFEIDRIGRRLAEEGRTAEVREALAARDVIWSEVRGATPRRRAESDDEWIERTALAFWSKDVPCALLGENGECTVHDVRPWSCRRSFAGSDPDLCRGEHARDPRRRFFTLSAYETFDEELGALDSWAPFAADSDRLDRALLRWIEAHGD